MGLPAGDALLPDDEPKPEAPNIDCIQDTKVLWRLLGPSSVS